METGVGPGWRGRPGGAVLEGEKRNTAKMTPEQVDKLITYGQMALEQGWYDQAREHFEQALDLDPSNQEAMKGLARANELLSRREAMAVEPIEEPVRRVEPKSRSPEKKRQGWGQSLIEWFKKRSRRGKIAILAGVPLLLICLFFGLANVISPPPEATPTTPPTAVVHVLAGEFLMGSNEGDPDANGSEHPQHTVYVSEFWIDKAEVTNAQYRECVEAGTCRAPTTCDWGEPTYSDLSKADHPVVCVSSQDAKTYCQRAGKRLPTEAEWEKTARGTDGRKYPWGNSFDGSKVNFSGTADGYQYTAPVGSYPEGASPYSVLDMAGNVWEWCQDWFGASYYASSPQRDPQGPNSGEYRVVRGGSWNFNKRLVRAAFRGWADPDSRDDDIGFRCVSQSPPTTMLTPAPTATPEPTDTPALLPTATPGLSAEEMVYATEVTDIFDDWTTATFELATLSSAASQNPLLLVDADWRWQASVPLATLQICGQRIRELAPPKLFQGVHQDLVQATRHSTRAATLFAQGVDELNPDKLIQSAEEMSLAEAYVQEATAKLERISQ